jgi:hypothetical protein
MKRALVVLFILGAVAGLMYGTYRFGTHAGIARVLAFIEATGACRERPLPGVPGYIL